MNLRLGAAALCAITAAAAAAPASAATTVYTDRASFLAATTITDTATYEGLVSPGFDGLFADTLLGNHGVFLAGGGITVMSKDFAPDVIIAASAYGSDYVDWTSPLLTVSFIDAMYDPGHVAAVGFDFMDNRGNPATFTFDIGGTTQVFSLAQSTSASFFGFVSDTPFDSFTIAMTGDAPDIYGLRATLDNVSYALAPPREVTPGPGVPEPDAWALMILGFGGTGVMFRWRRRTVLAARPG
jgi:hypothetical protein